MADLELSRTGEDRRLYALEGVGTLRLDDPAAVEPGLLLFAAFVVRGLAADASSAAAS